MNVPFSYQAIDASGRTVSDTIQAASPDEAARTLRARGLLITRLDEAGAASTVSEAAADAPTAGPRGFALLRHRRRTKVRWKDLVYFTQQMAMLLGSGARMVPALRAVEAQSRSDAMKDVIRHLRDRVEDGVPVNAAMADRPDAFDGVFTSLVAAGESSGRIAEAFAQLAAHARQQLEIRQRVIGALIYPALLVGMCTSIMVVLFAFVLPRFRELFTTLGADLPASTRMMLRASEWVGNHGHLIAVGMSGAIAAIVAFARSEAGRRWWAGAATRVPLAGVLVRRVILARLFRIWGLLVENNVGLIDAIRLAKSTTRSPAFGRLMDEVEEAVIDGRLIGATLHKSPLVPPTMAAAVATGEESGRLAAALLFIAEALESENAQMFASMSRIIEPIILIVMGLAVGVVAVSLFMPLFDIATIAGGH